MKANYSNTVCMVVEFNGFSGELRDGLGNSYLFDLDDVHKLDTKYIEVTSRVLLNSFGLIELATNSFSRFLDENTTVKM